MKKQFLDSGKIVGTHGIKGEVRIDPWCDSPEFLCAFKKLWLDENGTEFIEVKSRPHKNIALAKIKGVDTIEAAEKYRGKVVYINRDDINLAEGVHFFQDLIQPLVKEVAGIRPLLGAGLPVLDHLIQLLPYVVHRHSPIRSPKRGVNSPAELWVS